MAFFHESKGCTGTPGDTGPEPGDDRVNEQASGLQEVCGDQRLSFDATPCVDLYLYPGRSCRRKEYSLNTTLWEVKENCEQELRIPALVVAVAPLDSPSLSSLPWSTSLRDLGCKAECLSKLGVYLFRRAEDPEGHPPQLDSVGAPECLTDATAGRPRCMQFAAENAKAKTLAQTPSKECPLSLVATALVAAVLVWFFAGVKLVQRERRHAGIQTFTEASRSSQSQREDSGCPAKAGYFVSSLQDKEVYPRQYVTADEQLQTLTRNAIVIQKFARRWAARRAVQAMRQRRNLRMQQELQQLQRQQWEAEVRRKRQQQRGDNPVTPSDFALLLAEVEAWRRLEAEKILAKGGPPRKHKEALLLLLQQEMQLLRRIGRLKQRADKDRKKQQQQRLLEKMGAPLIWVQSNGETAAVHTPQTTRASELHSVFNRLSAEPQKVPERLEALAAAREAVGSHGGPVADELRDLLSREEALLNRGRCNPFFLSGLRQRISNEFFRLLLDTSFNRQAELVTKTAFL
ncbi:hypothetical protein ACSSS7_001806 [Eimeria intestinalis]